MILGTTLLFVRRRPKILQVIVEETETAGTGITSNLLSHLELFMKRKVSRGKW